MMSEVLVMDPMGQVKTAAIAGGGLAGLTCAKYLADAGVRVAVFEGLPYLGGRASTYRDQDGDWVEQGLHLFLGTYSEFRSLLREIGQPEHEVLFWMTSIRYQDPGRADATYAINPLRSPLQTVLGFLGQNDYLNPIDKLLLLPPLAPAILDHETLRRQYDGQTVADWWERVGGTRNSFERFVRPFCRAIQFTEAEQFSAYNFLGWVHNVVADLANSLAGGYRGAREESIFWPLARFLRSRGATIRTSVKLREVRYSPEAGRVTGFVLERGEVVEADAYVVAVPAWGLAAVLPGPLRAHPFFGAIDRLPVAPAIAVQVWFDRRVIATPLFTLVARVAVPVYQDQSACTYPYPRGDRISAIISPADEYLEWTDEALVRFTVDALARVEPGLAQARAVKSVVLKHTNHLIRPWPGAMSSRPTQATPVPNFYLAGDWTQQDYFGSQEGAVRAGKACARAILGARVLPSGRVSA